MVWIGAGEMLALGIAVGAGTGGALHAASHKAANTRLIRPIQSRFKGMWGCIVIINCQSPINSPQF
jgi:hypothetical protein